jgi:hypothetical protein
MHESIPELWGKNTTRKAKMLQFFKWQKNELRTTKKVKKNLII